MEFYSAKQPPKITFLHSTSEFFEQAVLPRLKSYRLPCLNESAAPVKVVQQFDFDPFDGRTVRPGNMDAVLQASEDCRGIGVEAGSVAYPRDALKKNEEGVVLLRATYGSPGTKPIRVDALNDIGSRSLHRAAESVAKETTVECSGPVTTWPKTALIPVRFAIAGEARYAFKDVSLTRFLGLVSDIHQQQVKFDLQTMSCPFDVQFTWYRPHLENAVYEVGTSDANRTPFLAWMKGLSLDIPSPQAKFLTGSTMRISVPCGVLDLKT
jgi:hypothetical protein